MPTYNYKCSNCEERFIKYLPLIDFEKVVYSKCCDFTAEKQLSSVVFMNNGGNSKGDGFQAGYNPGLGEVVRDRGHYKKLLKDKNMEECGHTKPKMTKKKTTVLDDSGIKAFVDSGIDLSGREVKALKDGKKLE